MKKTLLLKTFIKSLFFLSLVSVSYYSFTNGSGAPAGYTAAPGDANCTSCHSGSLITSGSNWNNVTITSNIPAAGYNPGDTYTITVSHTQTGINKFGFEFTALTSSSAAMAGSLAAGTGSQALTSGSKTYLTHNSSGTSGSGTKSWSFSWTAPSPGVGDVKFYLVINATNSDNSTSGDQIYAKNITVSQFSNLPTAVIGGIPANNTVCLGDTLYLTGSGINSPSSYAWTFSGKPASSTQNPAVVFTSIGQKTITLQTTNGFGSSAVNTKFVNVITKPAATISASNTNICGGDSVTLTANFNSLFTYEWTPNNETTQIIKTNTPGVYKVKVTNTTTGCANTSTGTTLLAKTKPVPVLTVSADTICSADSLTLSSSTPFNNYAFVDGSTSLQSGTSSSYKNLFASGNRNVGLVVTDGNGCHSDTAWDNVNVLPKLAAPVIACGVKTSSSVEFTWAAIAGASGYEVSTDGNSWGAPNGTLAHTVNGLAPNTNVQIWVRALDPGLCAKGNTGTQFCTNAACIPATFTITRDANVCVGSAQDTGHAQITLANISIPSFSIQYGAGGAWLASTSHIVPVMLGVNTITVKIKDSANLGCPTTDTTITITGVNPISTKPVLVTGGVLCSGDSAVHVLKVQNANSGADHFEIYKDGVGAPLTILNANGSAELTYVLPKPSVLHDGDHVYVIAIQDGFGCMKTSEQLTINIEPTPNVGFTVVPTGLSVELTDTTSGVSTRNWAFFGAFPDIMNGAASLTKVYPASGTYQVKLVSVSSAGCGAMTTRAFILTNVGLNDVKATQSISMYPNPVKDVLELNLVQSGTAVVSIYDMQGRLVKEETLEGTNKLNLAELHTGLYSMYVKQDANLYNGKFIKE